MSGPPSAHGRASLTRHSFSDPGRYAGWARPLVGFRDRRVADRGVIANLAKLIAALWSCGAFHTALAFTLAVVLPNLT